MLVILMAAIVLGKPQSTHSTSMPPICDKNLTKCESGNYPQCEFKEEYIHDIGSDETDYFSWKCVKVEDLRCSGMPIAKCSVQEPFLNCHVGYMGGVKWQCDSSSDCDEKIPKCSKDEISQCGSFKKPRVKEGITGKWNCASIETSGCSTLPFPECNKAEPVAICGLRGWECQWPLGWGRQPQTKMN